MSSAPSADVFVAATATARESGSPCRGDTFTLDRACGETGDDAVLEGEHQGDDRQRSDDRGGHDHPPGQLEGTRSRHQRDRHRHGALSVGE